MAFRELSIRTEKCWLEGIEVKGSEWKKLVDCVRKGRTNKSNEESIIKQYMWIAK